MATVIVLAAAVAGCSPTTGDLGSVATPAPTSAPSLDLPSTEPTGGPTPTAPVASAMPTGDPSQGTMTVRAYFFLGSFVDNAGLVPVLRQVPQTQAVGAAAMRELLAGPNSDELAARPAMYTTVPEGTRFLGLDIGNGMATVNLSREFESGGGSASVLGRLAQVVYTLTQFPTIEAVTFQVDGNPLTVFSGQGVVLDHPVTRSDYRDQLPAIFVDRPAWGGALGNPARLAGVANVFEAQFEYQFLDGAGSSVRRSTISSTCGTGCWGTFEITVPYSVPNAGWGTLRVYERSAAEGSPINITEYPVWLAP